MPPKPYSELDSDLRINGPGYIGLDFLIRKPEVREAIGCRYDERSLFNVTFHSGEPRTTAQHEYHRWEYDRMFLGAKIESVTTGTGNQLVLTLTDDSHKDAGKSSPFQVSDMVDVNGVRCRVQAKNSGTDNAHTITVEPEFLTGQAWPDPLDGLNNQYIWKFGSSFADGTGAPSSVARKPSRISNYVQLFKNMYESTGQETATQFVVVTTQSGNRHFYHQGVEDLLTRHIADIEMTMVHGIKGTTTDADGNTVYTTGGLDWYVRTYGTTYTEAAFSKTVMDTIAKKLNEERGAMEIEAHVEHDLKLAIDDTLRDINNNTGVKYTYNAFNGNEEMAAQFGFSQFSYGGRTYHIKTWDLLSEVQTFGNHYKNVGYFLPVGQYKDSKSQQELRNRELRTLQSAESGSRFMKEYSRDQTVTATDRFEWHVQSDVGLDMGLLNSSAVLRIS